jgi:hypothetical protein
VCLLLPTFDGWDDSENRGVKAYDVITATGDLQVVMLTSHVRCANLTSPSCWNISKGIAFDPSWNPPSSQPARDHVLAYHVRSATGNSTRGGRADGAASAAPTRGITVQSSRSWEEPGAIYDSGRDRISVMVRVAVFQWVSHAVAEKLHVCLVSCVARTVVGIWPWQRAVCV